MVTGTVQDLIDDAIRLINEDINTPIPLLKRDEWQKGRNAKARANREEQRANNAESRLSMMERFVRQVGASEAFTHWSLLTKMVDKAKYNYPILPIDNLNNSFLSKVRENALKQKTDSIAGAEREKLERF